MNNAKFDERLREEINNFSDEILELKERIFILETKINDYNDALGCKHQIITETHRVRHSKNDNLTVAKCIKCNIEFEVD